MTTAPVANHPTIFTHRSPLSSSSSLLFLNRTNFIPYFSTTKRNNSTNCNGYRTRCSVAKDYTVPPSEISGGSGHQYPELDCVVVGAGISGLCIAKVISANYPNLMVTEARDRAGGNITTVERDGYLWEEGPNSFQPSDPMLTMAVDCGLKDDLVLGDPDSPRFVLWKGKLRPVPGKLSDLPFFDLMSIPGKLRAGFGAIGLRPSPPGYEESVEEFVRRNLGAEVFERLIEPFCSGVYAGDPSKLSMKAAFGKVWKLEQTGGSIIGGTFKAIKERSSTPKAPRDPRLPTPKGQTVGSFRKGLRMLPDAICERLGSKVKLSWKLSTITKSEKGGYQLTYETPEGVVSLRSRSIVMTVPSYVASSILRPLSVAAADALSNFYYPPVAAVTVSYPQEAIRDDRLVDGELKGFGQLHPRSQGVETLGTIYSSSLFPNRAPNGRVLLLNYIGGATNSEILSKTESQLVEAVDRDLRKMLIKPKAQDPFVTGVRVWPQAIPQFLVGHLDTLGTAKAALSDNGLDGLFLGGNYVSGVALGRCVEGAYEIASDVTGFLSKYAYK
ncbi:protoporphyrinogen oxidase, chloroplastic [Lycium ferocissimum]|uniref:protoporphyrinogen oxidase, chloroplastic n=1 Tax=Lycium ferocissimum TaxID=112874 RepID=UPI002814AE4F|nr:protoporphyrinogen oxidase, chloroplastic [Lycium ferocissimum]XP_059311737.1 protoporphyrinogen oxidase, chloroplastic [Lycium ferocissimum]